MTTHGAAWDEELGGDRTDNSLFSFPEGKFYAATRKAWAWTKSGSHAPDRWTIPSWCVEALFEHAPFKNTTEDNTVKVMTHTLGLREFIEGALEALIEAGLLVVIDTDGEQHDRVFDNPTELYERADQIILANPDNPAFVATERSFEWFEGFDDTQAEHTIKWFAPLSVTCVCRRTSTLQSYVALTKHLGDRGTAKARIDCDKTFFAMVGGGTGGQLVESLKAYYYHGQTSAPTSLEFLRGRI